MIHGVIFAEINGKVAEGIEDGHIQFIVLFWAQIACPKLRNKSRAGRTSG